MTRSHCSHVRTPANPTSSFLQTTWVHDSAADHGYSVLPYASPACRNVGLLPQTWATGDDESTGMPADQRPIECIELGDRLRVLGEVYVVKTLGAFAVIDQISFQLSWKILSVAADDPMARGLGDWRMWGMCISGYPGRWKTSGNG